jgi:hypothetical protein
MAADAGVLSARTENYGSRSIYSYHDTCRGDPINWPVPANKEQMVTTVGMISTSRYYPPLVFMKYGLQQVHRETPGSGARRASKGSTVRQPTN